MGPARGAALPGRRRPARRLAAAATPTTTSDVRVVGHRWSERSHEVKTFLARNHVPYRWLDVERDEEARPAARPRRRRRPTTCRWCCVPDGETLRAPSTLELADALGLRTRAEQPLYDLCIVGGGPAGLAAAVYAASEGLQHRRRRARGARRPGRAERGDRELPRLPEGAVRRRPHPPGRRPGVAGSAPRWCWPATSSGFETRGPGARRAASTAAARSRRARVLVATGVSYRRLEAPGVDELTGRGVYYGATASEARPVRGRRRLRRRRRQLGRPGRAELRPLRQAGRAARPRRRRSRTTMSQYLVERITRRRQHRGAAAAPRSSAARGDGHLERLTLADRDTGAERGGRRRAGCSSSSAPRRAPTGSATTSPATSKGFVVTGPRPRWPRRARRRWPLARAAVRAGDERARGVRRRRRAAGLDEAGRLGRRRGRDVGLPRAPLPGDDLMRRRRPAAAARSSTGSTDDQLGRAARGGRARSPFEPGDDAVPRGRARRRLVGAARRARRPACARSAARRPCVGDDGRARPVGRRLPGLGRARRLPRHRPRRRRRAGCSGCRPRRCGELVDALVPVRRAPDRRPLPAPRAASRPTARQREALVALGTLAAGLAHEINNPARRRPARSTRCRRRLRRRCSSSLAQAGRAARSPPSSSSRSTRCGRELEPPTTGADPLATGRPRGGAVGLAGRPRRRRATG